MVRSVTIIDMSDAEWSSEEEKEDLPENAASKSPVPPEPSDPPAQETASALEPIASGPHNPGPSSPVLLFARSAPTLRAAVVPSVLRFGVNHQYFWYLIRQYGTRIDLNRSIEDGPATAERQGPSEYRPLPVFSVSFLRPSTPSDYRSEGDSRTEHVINHVSVANTSYSTIPALINPSSAPVLEDESSTSEGTTKEKSNGISEKEQVAAAAAVTTAGEEISSSPELSDYELSDESDPLQSEENQQAYQTTSLIDCPWSQVVDPNTNDAKDVDRELTGSAGNDSWDSDDGEAAALLFASRVRDSTEHWVSDDRLFALDNREPDGAAASTSSAADETGRIPSPATARRHVKQRNRERAREQAIRKCVKRFISVPTEKIGRIIGKGGRNINILEQKTGARVKINNHKSSQPLSQITLTGTEEQIAAAHEGISLIVRNFKPPKTGETTTAAVNTVDDEQLRQLVIGIRDQVLDAEKSCRPPEN